MRKAKPYNQNLVVEIPSKYESIVKSMLDKTTGVKVEDRTYRLKTYPNCFIASQLVDWLQMYYQFKLNQKITREEATDFGEKLREADIFAHVVDAHNFKDGYFFFRFQVDEKSKIMSPELEKKLEEEEKEKSLPLDFQGKTVHDFKVLDIDKKEVDLSIYKGYVKLFVNVASA